MKKTIAILFMLIGLATFASSASALCITPEEEGVWKNIDRNTRSVTEAEVHLSQCGDVVLNGVREPTLYSVRLWGKCHPSDCDWGTVNGERHGDWIRVTYDFSFKTATVWTKTYSFYGRNYLRVYVRNNYYDTRADQVFDDWYLPE
jgi:hypothetical protein